ncbi:MAG: hypothetical protein R2862_07050 [Thermoanaerobaculia bacterium]
MKDNVLIFTEDHVSPNLAELGSYFAGCLKLDGREFRTRLMRVNEWYADLCAPTRSWPRSPGSSARSPARIRAPPQPSRLPDVPRRPPELRSGISS